MDWMHNITCILINETVKLYATIIHYNIYIKNEEIFLLHDNYNYWRFNSLLLFYTSIINPCLCSYSIKFQLQFVCNNIWYFYIISLPNRGICWKWICICIPSWYFNKYFFTANAKLDFVSPKLRWEKSLGLDVPLCLKVETSKNKWRYKTFYLIQVIISM